MKNLLEVRGLTVELPTPAGWVRPVNDVSLHIAAGESLGLVGESGSGKTMLALALMPPGCAFELRCALRRAECSQGVPDLRYEVGMKLELETKLERQSLAIYVPGFARFG
jgi:ABC-type dipeptide/oligopeptide/nickel transport system ATPase component